jgi:putative GTP pyrophosphokinase
MDSSFSKTQIDKLGDRLRTEEPSEEDLRQLDGYRRSFMNAYEHVAKIVRDQLNLEPTGRPAKSNASVREKLRRESIRLSQMQDIAGCRVIVDGLDEQDRTVKAMSAAFSDITIVDRRIHPSHGYRAVHVIVDVDGKHVEIQVRTMLQHVWAELSEKCADVFDPALKYGGGRADLSAILAAISRVLDLFEASGLAILKLLQKNRDLQNQLDKIEPGTQIPAELAANVANSKKTLESLRNLHSVERARMKALWEDSIQKLLLLKGK